MLRFIAYPIYLLERLESTKDRESAAYGASGCRGALGYAAGCALVDALVSAPGETLERQRAHRRRGCLNPSFLLTDRYNTKLHGL